MNSITEQEKNLYNQLLSDLVSIPSVKSEASDDAPYGPMPKRALEYLLGRAKKDGFIVENIGNKAGYIQWGTQGPLVAVLGHLDVVPEGSGWNLPAFELTEFENCFYGRGVIDDKGPVVSAYLALLRFKSTHADPSYRVRLIVGTDEEHGSSCMERYCETEELPDIGFTPDAEFPCIYAEKGICQIHFEGNTTKEFTLHGGEAANMVPPYCECIDLNTFKGYCAEGLQAHASHPDMGVNAIEKILDKLPEHIVEKSAHLQLFKKYFLTTSPTPFASFFKEDESGKMTTNVGMVHINKDEARLHVDIRFPVTIPSSEVMAKLNEIASEYQLKVVTDSLLEPLFKDKDSDQIKTLVSIYDKYRSAFAYEKMEKEKRERSLSVPSSAIAIGGGTYARTMPNIVAFGPQLPWNSDQCHQANENVLIENMYLLVPMYEEALEKLGNIVS